MWTERPAHPLLVPPDFIHAVIVASAVRYRRLIKLRVEQHAAKRVLSAGGSAINADARDVVVRILRGDCLVPEDSIRETRIAKILPGDIVESFRTIRCSHAIDLHHDESQFGQRLR